MLISGLDLGPIPTRFQMKDNGQLNIFQKKILDFHWLVSFGARFKLKLAKNGQKVKKLKKYLKKCDHVKIMCLNS